MGHIVDGKSQVVGAVFKVKGLWFIQQFPTHLLLHLQNFLNSQTCLLISTEPVHVDLKTFQLVLLCNDSLSTCQSETIFNVLTAGSLSLLIIHFQM